MAKIDQKKSKRHRQKVKKRPRKGVRNDDEWILPWDKPQPGDTWPIPAENFGSQYPAPIEEPKIDTSKPTSIFQPTGRVSKSTVSIAIPSSILNIAQTFELKAQLAARIARAAAVFCVDEIVIFEDGNEVTNNAAENVEKLPATDQSKPQEGTDVTDILLHILQYLECPPHLRRQLIPFSPYLRTAGALPSLDMPHHLREDEWCQYREGITIAQEADEQINDNSHNTMNEASQKPIGQNNSESHNSSAEASQKRKRERNGETFDRAGSDTPESSQHASKKQKVESKSAALEANQGGFSRGLNFAQILWLEAGLASYHPSLLSIASSRPETDESSSEFKQSNVTIVNCGFPFTIPAFSAEKIPPNTRVTLRFPNKEAPPNFQHLKAAQWYGHDATEPEFRASIVETTEPKQKGGYYWGYDMRFARNLTKLYTECPYEGGYDVTIGTSERGIPLSNILPTTATQIDGNGKPLKTRDTLPDTYNHALIVFGGVAGLERALEYDQELLERIGGDAGKVGKVFDIFVNAVPGQGSRTIRTEEAVWIVLGMLNEWINTGRV